MWSSESQVNRLVFFQVFHLTALIVRGPLTSGERFIINLERVMICKDEVCGALLCVEDIVISPHFTQRNFFSDSGIAILAESAAICDSITGTAVFEPWSQVETASCSQVVAEIGACVNQTVDRRRSVKGSLEQSCAVGGIRLSSENSASRSGVKISNTMEERRVDYVFVSVSSISTSGSAIFLFLRESPRRGKLVGALWSYPDASNLQYALHCLNSIV